MTNVDDKGDDPPCASGYQVRLLYRHTSPTTDGDFNSHIYQDKYCEEVDDLQPEHLSVFAADIIIGRLLLCRLADLGETFYMTGVRHGQKPT